MLIVKGGFLMGEYTNNEIIAAIVIIVVALIALSPVMLFIKVWIMTNDVEKIKLMIEERLEAEASARDKEGADQGS